MKPWLIFLIALAAARRCAGSKAGLLLQFADSVLSHQRRRFAVDCHQSADAKLERALGQRRHRGVVTNATVVVDASTNLQDWIPISTNTLVNGTSTFLDSAWTNNPQRFYRVRLQ